MRSRSIARDQLHACICGYVYIGYIVDVHVVIIRSRGMKGRGALAREGAVGYILAWCMHIYNIG